MRMTRWTAWAGASTATLIFLVLAWVLPNVLGLEGSQLWILRGVLAFLGLVAGVLLQRMLALRARSSAPRKTDPARERMDLLLKEARARLASGEAETSRLSRLPVLMVLGPPGSTKTTTVLQSGLDPDLLAGEVHRGETVAPTESVNLWYGDGIVVAEAGGDVSEHGDRWAYFIRKLKPARLAAALLRKRQPPRVALLCVSCEEFLKPGASSSLPELARSLRSRLSDAALEFGIHMPVYVLFTKADRLPHFAEFVRNLTAEEAAEALGVTLPLKAFSSSGSYGDEQTRRLDQYLEELEEGLAAKRLELLPRENSEEVRQAAYEFPREIGKLSHAVRDFLVELCRPRHLGTSPVLRGFYFTGVRAVYLRERSAEAAEIPSVQEEPTTAGATSVFSAEEIRREAERQEGGREGSTRKVPQWVFLRRMVHDVIFRDRAAMGLTGSGAGVSLLRRTVLAGVVGAACITLLGMGTSFFMNRGLQRNAALALEAVESAPPPEQAEDAEVEDGAGSALPMAQLEALDSLGAELDRLRDWADTRPPFRYRWGLYRGPALLPEVRAAYFRRFRELLWNETRERMVAFLQALPPEPTEESDYEATYDALKAYLIATEHPERSDVTFLPPVLLSHWGRSPDEEDPASDLARRHFQRFARELQAGNPYDDRASESIVAGTRSFLGEFAAVDRFYQSLVSRVSGQLDGFHFHDAYPGARDALRNEFAVPGAFTREGWAAVQEMLQDPDALLVSEEWVVGEQAVTAEERAELAQAIGERYEREYVTRWQDFLRAGRVPAFDGSLSAASNALDLLGGNDSPLVQMLSAASRHTAVDAEEVRAAFQPIHLLVPPPDTGEEEDEEEEPSADENVREYLDGLINLRSSLDDLPGNEGARLEQGVIQAERDASQVERTIGQLTRDFEREGGARSSGDAVARLMEEPVTWASRLLGRYEATQAADGVNSQGADLCRRFGDLTRLYPFSGDASSDADVDDVKAAFQPGESRLSAFHDEVMDDLVTRAGGRYEPRSGAALNPTGEFLAFYNRADRISRALFNTDGEGPRAAFFLRVEASGSVPEIEVVMDGQRQVYTPTAAPLREFVWEGEQARTMRIEAQVQGGRRTIVETEGTWAPFRLFQAAERWEDLGGGTYRVSWQVPGEEARITADVTFADAGAPVFRPGFLTGLSCVSRVVR